MCKVHVSPGHKRKDGTQVRYRSYVCPDPAAGGDRCVRRDADAVDAYMLDHVNWWLEPGGDYHRYLELLKARGDLTAQITEAEQEISTLELRQQAADQQAAKGVISWERAGKIEAEISRELGELTLVRDALHAARAGRAEAMQPAQAIHADAWAQWAQDAPDEAHAWLRRFIGRVTLRPTGRGRRQFNGADVTVEPGAWADEIGRSTVRPLPAAKIPAQPGRHEDTVVGWLAGHPGATAREIADGAGVGWSSVYVILDALEAAGRLTRERAGRGRGGGKVSMRFTLAEPPADAAEAGSALSGRAAATRAVAAYWIAAAARSVSSSVHVISSPLACTQAVSCSGV
jgi:hypothetical protein